MGAATKRPSQLVHLTLIALGCLGVPPLHAQDCLTVAAGAKPHRPSAGLGLGLYISERIIDAHRGTLSVESAQEAGTRFEVVLPREP